VELGNAVQILISQEILLMPIKVHYLKRSSVTASVIAFTKAVDEKTEGCDL